MSPILLGRFFTTINSERCVSKDITNITTRKFHWIKDLVQKHESPKNILTVFSKIIEISQTEKDKYPYDLSYVELKQTN